MVLHTLPERSSVEEDSVLEGLGVSDIEAGAQQWKQVARQQPVQKATQQCNTNTLLRAAGQQHHTQPNVCE